MYGMDLSNYQKGIDLSKGQYDFCIIKATEGIGYVDPSFHEFTVQLTKLNKLIGCYHFARPDLHNTVTTMRTEAEWFIREVERAKLLGKAILVLDWEVEPMDREDLVSIWCETVLTETGAIPIIYGSSSKIGTWIKEGWRVVDRYPIWIARWPSIKRVEVGRNPGFKYPDGDWRIWQYSSMGIYPGFSGNVDLDYCKLDKEGWVSMAGYKEKDLGTEKLTDDMNWAIYQGLFVGYGNGKYGPNDPITREQLASVLRRYTRLIGEANLAEEMMEGDAQ